jgi:hypothetical protein
MIEVERKKLAEHFPESRGKSFAAILLRNTSLAGLLALAMIFCGCGTCRPPATVTKRPFDFQADTMAFPNELVWLYHYDAHGKWVSEPRVPAPEYSHHCFVVARSALQFFEHARFEPALPVADAKTYRHLIDRVLANGPSRITPDAKKVVIPGYANLHEFSEAQAPLLKSECGGAWQSYFQHGHWRMVMPFSRHHQEKMAEQLVADLKAERPPVVHIVRFPQLTVNHALVLFGETETPKEIQFATYDPNDPSKSKELIFDRATRTFNYAANDYFAGGRVDVYEVYRNWKY